VLVVVAVAACSERRAVPAQAEPPPALDLPKPAAAAGSPTSAGDSGEPLAPIAAVQRKLIQNAELEVEVKSYADARPAVDAEIARVKGYVANAQIDHAEGRVSRAELSLRVPAEQLTDVLAAFKKLGTVLHESVKTQDITEEYVDLQARRSNARKLESRLLELLASGTKDVKDLLEVERELSRVRETLERLEGKLKLYDSQVAMSTITLRLVSLQTYQAGKPRGLGEQLSDTLGSSWQALVTFGRALLVIFVGLLPWLPLIIALGWLGWRLLRWVNRRLVSAPRTMAAAGPYGRAISPEPAAAPPTRSVERAKPTPSKPPPEDPRPGDVDSDESQD